MKNIYLRRNGYYFSKMQNGRRIWVNLQTKELSEAVKRTEELSANPIIKSAHSMEDDVKRFIKYKVEKGQYSWSSSITKNITLTQFVRSLPDNATISSVTVQQVSRFYNDIRKKASERTKRTVSESTAHGYMMTIRSFFRWAIETERARIDNPVDKIELYKVTRAPQKPWAKRDFKNKLLEKAPNDELRFILFCGFDAGLRKLEIIEARRDWFDLDNGILHIRKSIGNRLREGERPFLIKDREERSITLTEPFKNFLKQYLKGLNPLDFALYADVKYGKAKYRYDFKKPFEDYMKDKKCKWITPHIMRHSFASILASAGVSIFKISEWLGDDVRTTQKHYAKLAAGDSDIHMLSG